MGFAYMGNAAEVRKTTKRRSNRLLKQQRTLVLIEVTATIDANGIELLNRSGRVGKKEAVRFSLCPIQPGYALLAPAP